MGPEVIYQRELVVGNPHDGTLLTVLGHDEKAVKPLRYGVRVGTLGLLVPQGVLSEVAEHRPVFPIPYTAPWFEGVCNNRGDVVPVFNLHRLLEFDTDCHDRDNDLLLMIGQQEFAVALRIYDYPRPVRVGGPCPMPSGLPAGIAEHISQSYVFGKEVWSDFKYRDFFMALKARLAVHPL